MDRERIEIENEILDSLAGKIFLLQDITCKRDIIFKAFLELYNSSKGQKIIGKTKDLDVEKFFNEFLTYGVIEEFLADPAVEDIMINYLKPIYVHKTKIGLVKTDKQFTSREELDLFVKKLIIFSGRKTMHKINNVELSEIKGRANIAYSPFGPQITITRAKEKPLSIVDLIKNGTINLDLAAQFWLYMEGLKVKPANIIIAGGPGAGKSTFLNALFSFIPSSERTVVIEDTLELNTDDNDNFARLESDEDTSLEDLVKNSLRMRPDRVVVGEVRGREARDLMTAMNIGKYCVGTIHASTPREAILRLQNEPMNVPEVLVNLVDVFVIMRRYEIDGQVRRVIGELAETGGMEQKMVLLSSLWYYDLGKKDFHETAVSSIYRDKLAQVSGVSGVNIINEVNLRRDILELLAKKNISDINEVTKICQKYSSDPSGTLKELGIRGETPLKR